MAYLDGTELCDARTHLTAARYTCRHNTTATQVVLCTAAHLTAGKASTQFVLFAVCCVVLWLRERCAIHTAYHTLPVLSPSVPVAPMTWGRCWKSIEAMCYCVPAVAGVLSGVKRGQ